MPLSPMPLMAILIWQYCRLRQKSSLVLKAWIWLSMFPHKRAMKTIKAVGVGVKVLSRTTHQNMLLPLITVSRKIFCAACHLQAVRLPYYPEIAPPKMYWPITLTAFFYPTAPATLPLQGAMLYRKYRNLSPVANRYLAFASDTKCLRSR